jgi:hypothetical protein
MSQHKVHAEKDKKTQEEKGRWNERGWNRATWHTGLKMKPKIEDPGGNALKRLRLDMGGL